MTVSKTRVQRAGDALRDHDRGVARLDRATLAEHVQVVEGFRAAHAAPLTRVAANLRYYVAEASGGTFVVGQRLKRLATIRDKLQRHPKMSLPRMHDIGGCRAVLPTQAAVDEVIRRLRSQRRWVLLSRTWDYVAEPKADGYRAKHLVIVKDGVHVELQLRTNLQHAWAELVEQLDRETGAGLKTGRATAELEDMMRNAAELFAAFEEGQLRLRDFDPTRIVGMLSGLQNRQNKR